MGRKGIEIVMSELEREQLLSMGRSRSLPHSGPSGKNHFDGG